MGVPASAVPRELGGFAQPVLLADLMEGRAELPAPAAFAAFGDTVEQARRGPSPLWALAPVVVAVSAWMLLS